MINKETLEKTAKLSRLSLNQEEESKLLGEMGQILDYFEALQAIDAEGVEPLYTPVQMENEWRRDQNEEREQHSKLLDSLQERSEGQIKVPQVV